MHLIIIQSYESLYYIYFENLGLDIYLFVNISACLFISCNTKRIIVH